MQKIITLISQLSITYFIVEIGSIKNVFISGY